ncbi:efflux RND transporter periplasmic adaptor subunit [Actinophytocola algeriensis]|uniref:Macrolide-specific efflux system membrane fusion protein n=1 Tax=Actinophytocola algeriensis TaxID=1768010 RepID=A0A7W7PZ51_9PSEU|nr:biotin/lipoyl-binding protein [Actinophytocola algeriensis]MBB4903866.1 macrolide-specific efflux system membrane fusion protein [Actinophytocola algeriensis]MBE1477277.1 macrolide-specific efflux system membrane fusion protein [Actinophytocola algeriensis]
MRRRLLVLAGVVVVAAGGGAAWWLLKPAEATAAPVVVPVTVGTQRQTVSASGTVEPAQRADLSFSVSGEVTGVLVQEGDAVTAGQALATVDDTLLAAQLTAAQARLDAAEDKAADSDDATAAADDAAVVSAQSDVAAAQDAVDQATLTAPMAGTVAAVDLAVGDRVGTTQQNGAEDATAQITVVSTGTFVVAASVSAADAAQVKQGLAAEITPVGADEPVEGTVRTVGLVASADESGAATFPVTIDVTGTRDDLYAGSSATAVIVVAKRENVLTVPAMALHTEGGTTYVNKVVDGTAVRTGVTTGEAFGMQTEVTSGLAEGDEVEVRANVQNRAPGGGGGGGGDTVFPGGGGGPMGGGPGGLVIKDGGGR